MDPALPQRLRNVADLLERGHKPIGEELVPLIFGTPLLDHEKPITRRAYRMGKDSSRLALLAGPSKFVPTGVIFVDADT